MSHTHDDGMDPKQGILADLESLRAARRGSDSDSSDEGHSDPAAEARSLLDGIAEAAGKLREQPAPAEPESYDEESTTSDEDDRTAGRTAESSDREAANVDSRRDSSVRNPVFEAYRRDEDAGDSGSIGFYGSDSDSDSDETDDDAEALTPASHSVDPRNPFSHSTTDSARSFAPVAVPTGGGLLFQPPQEELAQRADPHWSDDDDHDDDGDSGDGSDAHDDYSDSYSSSDRRSHSNDRSSDSESRGSQNQESHDQEQTQSDGQTQTGGESDDDSEDDGRSRSRRRRGGRGRRSRSRGGSSASDDRSSSSDDSGPDDRRNDDSGDTSSTHDSEDDGGSDDQRGSNRSSRRRRSSGGSQGDSESSSSDSGGNAHSSDSQVSSTHDDAQSSNSFQDDEEDEGGNSRRRRRRRSRTPRREGTGTSASSTGDDQVTALKGSTRLEAKRQRRREGREAGRRRPLLTEAEFLARRESVSRTMLVREQGERTQLVVLEDGIAVEHYLSEHKAQASLIGNVYVGRVQNVLPSMEAAFIDIGKGRNAVLYAGEVNWDALGMGGKPHRIEQALSPGDPVLVQVTKDPVGHKGARLTSQISLPGRFLVYIPGNSMTGISRKLPDTERARLKKLLKEILPEKAGVIVRTASEGASDEELSRDVERLSKRWESIEKKSQATKPAAPRLLYSEPDMIVRIIRDVFNEDFESLVIDGDGPWETIHEYVEAVAPDLLERVSRYGAESTDTADSAAAGTDIFEHFRVNEQIEKALSRKVNLPSGGSLVIDRTEAMTVIDVNTGKFTGSGGNLEETVTKNNLEAADEVIRQLRLRDIGGIIVVDFIDMVLEANRDLVTRRLVECLARDRTRHQVAEVTSLGLVQMTRKRIGTGLAESFDAAGEDLSGRGLMLPEAEDKDTGSGSRGPQRNRRRRASEGSGQTAAPAPAETPDQGDAQKQNESRSAVAAIAKATLKKPESDEGSDTEDRSVSAERTDDSGASSAQPSETEAGGQGGSQAGASQSSGQSRSRSRRRGGRSGGASAEASTSEAPAKAAAPAAPEAHEAPVAPEAPEAPAEPAPPAEPAGPAPLMIGADTTTSIQKKAAPAPAPSADPKAKPAEAAHVSAKAEDSAPKVEESKKKAPPILMLGMDD